MNDYDKSSNKLAAFDTMQLVLGNDVDFMSNKCEVNDPSQGFTGAIRGFNVWNKKLTDERVMNIFKGVDEKNDMLIAWSDFNSTDDVKKEFYIPWTKPTTKHFYSKLVNLNYISAPIYEKKSKRILPQIFFLKLSLRVRKYLIRAYEFSLKDYESPYSHV